MEDPDDHAALSLLEESREALHGEITELEHERQQLEAQLEVVGTKLEAKLRVLRLVEATEQQLGRHEPRLHESGPTPAAAFRRPRSSSPDAEPQPLPTRAVPIAVWEDHLLPLLRCQDAARLGCSCKALRGVVREHFKDVGQINTESLEAALTSFPRVRTVVVGFLEDTGRSDVVEALVQWLREGGRGRSLERVTTMSEYAGDVFHKVLQEGTLPSLKCVPAVLKNETHRASLTGGLVAAVHELRVTFDTWMADAVYLRPQLAALGLVRQLPALAKLEVTIGGWRYGEAVQWPPFIPPSLKSLRIELWLKDVFATESLLHALHDMLGASGARLDRLEVLLPIKFKFIGNGLVHLAQALRCCSPTLKGFYLGMLDSSGTWVAPPLHVDKETEGYASKLEWLRVQWADVMSGVSACRELEVLVLPRITVEPLFPPGTAFASLTHLEISDHEREYRPAAGVMGLWKLVASGGLPALAKLSLRLEGRWGGIEEVRTRVAPALEAVAGTLLHLDLDKVEECGWLSDEVDVGYELGVAVGKLQWLKDLALSLSEDGRVYEAVGGSGGEWGESPSSAAVAGVAAARSEGQR
jgi:hypothetical protein